MGISPEISHNYLKRMVNEHESLTDIFAGCQPNNFQMPPRYHAESSPTTPTSQRRKSPRTGDNIKTALMVDPCSRTSGGRGFSDSGSSRAVNF